METVRTLVRRYPLVSFFALALGLSWIAWIPYILGDAGLGMEPAFDFPEGPTSQLLGVLPGAYIGPLGAAFVVTTLVEGRAGLRQWAKRLVRWRVGWKWYVSILLLVPGTIVASTFVLPDATDGLLVPGWQVALAFIPMVIGQFLTTATAEEPGWRDFALPRLQDKFGPVLGTTILGVLWGVWHLPLFATEWGGYPDVTWFEPTLFVVCCVPLSFVMTWIFNKTGQSLPIVMVFHAAINSTYSLLWPAIFPKLDTFRETLVVNLVAAGGATIVLLLLTRGRLGLRTESPEDAPVEPRPLVPEVRSGPATFDDYR